MKAISGRIVAVAAMLLSLGAGSARGAEPEDIIKYRQNSMKANGAHMAAVAAILQGKVDYRKPLIDHARALEALNRDVTALFPKDSDFGETEALDAVWQKPEEFGKRAKDVAAKASAFLRSATSADAKAQLAAFRELSDSCKACHKDFRKEQKK